MRATTLFVVACLGGAAASQVPSFAQQYKQRLGGTIDELARIVVAFDRDAKAHGLKREAAVARFSEANDPFLARRGRSMALTIERWHDMSDHWRALDGMSSLTTLPTLLGGLDVELARRTWDAYRPAIPMTPTGLLHAGAGFLLTRLALGGLTRLLFGRRRRRRMVAEPA